MTKGSRIQFEPSLGTALFSPLEVRPSLHSPPANALRVHLYHRGVERSDQIIIYFLKLGLIIKYKNLSYRLHIYYYIFIY